MYLTHYSSNLLESGWNVMAHGDALEKKWRGNWRMEWVASTLHTTSEHGVSSITTADAHTSVASSRLNWRPRRFKLTRPFRRKTKSGFCACAITFQTQSTLWGYRNFILSYLTHCLGLALRDYLHRYLISRIVLGTVTCQEQNPLF
jgi:hypothetical protein